MTTRFTKRRWMGTRLAARRLLAAMSDDRGDVPGWVLVAVMTAGLVTAIWLVADDQLTAILGRALGSVTAP
jgi:hypothetical protein